MCVCVCVCMCVCVCVTTLVFCAQEQLSEETRLKIAASSKSKQLADEVEQLQQQVEDEEEAKQSLQTKLMSVSQQV